MKAVPLVLIVLTTWHLSLTAVHWIDRIQASVSWMASGLSSLSNRVACGLTLGKVCNRRQPKSPSRPLSPVIFIPGIFGSRLEAKIDKPETACDTSHTWKTIFLDFDYFLPPLSDCFKQDFKLYYNSSSRHTYSPAGVRIRPFKFGDMMGIKYTNPYIGNQAIQDSLVAQGYVVNKNLRGAPFDFRKAHTDNVKFAVPFRQLVEETFRTNGNTPVYLVAYSSGGLNTLHFLSTQSQPWKDKYIEQLIAISGPWAGSGLALPAIAGGFYFLTDLVKGYSDAIRSFSSPYSFLPSMTVFGNETLVSYRGHNYTAHDYDALLELYNIPNAKMMYENSKALTIDIPHPMVDVHCIHGDGVDTVKGLVYDSEDDFPNDPNIQFGPGDSFINTDSLMACKRWSRNTQYKFNYTLIKGASHIDIINDQRTLDLLKQIVIKSKT